MQIEAMKNNAKAIILLSITFRNKRSARASLQWIIFCFSRHKL